MIFFSNKQQVDMLHYQVDQAPASHDHGDNVAARGAEVVGEYGTIAEKRPLCQNKGPLKTSFMAQFSLKRGFCHKIAETPTFSKTTGAHSAALFTNGKTPTPTRIFGTDGCCLARSSTKTGALESWCRQTSTYRAGEKNNLRMNHSLVHTGNFWFQRNLKKFL